MRLEYRIELDSIEVPRFSVEAVEGIGKLFTLAALVLNVLETKRKVDLVFHGLNPDDPERKIVAFKEIIGSASSTQTIEYREGKGGAVTGSSSYYQWLTLEKAP
jgi:hypothetical protein